MIHITEAEAVRDFAGLLARVRTGTEIVIDGGVPVILSKAVETRALSLRERIALLPDRPTPVDEDFATDVAAARHREPLGREFWD